MHKKTEKKLTLKREALYRLEGINGGGNKLAKVAPEGGGIGGPRYSQNCPAPRAPNPRMGEPRPPGINRLPQARLDQAENMMRPVLFPGRNQYPQP
jgi:hypothetical protein